jgi:hypothetical protein
MNGHDASSYQYHHLMNAAKFGAVVGAAGAAACNIRRVREEGLAWQQATLDTAKVALGTGAATAAATAVGSLFQRQPLLGLAATLATGTAVMYVIDDIGQRAKGAPADE